MERHYFDITINTPVSLINQKTSWIGRLVHGIKRGMGEHSPNIGLCFPGWQPGQKDEHTSLGRVIRIVGDRFAVQQMHRHTLVGALAESGNALVGDIEPVPADAREVRFVRDRLQSKYHQLRKLHPNIDHPSLRVKLPYIELKSASNARTYRVYVRMEPADKYVSGEFNNYGLSKDGSTVPLF